MTRKYRVEWQVEFDRDVLCIKIVREDSDSKRGIILRVPDSALIETDEDEQYGKQTIKCWDYDGEGEEETVIGGDADILKDGNMEPPDLDGLFKWEAPKSGMEELLAHILSNKK